MSLFKLCRWWYTQCPDFASNYDYNSMHCCRIGFNDNDKDYIVVGSLSGHLSIFNPSGDPPENNSDNAFKATDVLIEMKLPNPIIGILSGKFIVSKEGGKCQLAILHPMKISIYALHTTDGVALHGDQTKLELCYEYKFQRFAFSCCKGNFGSVKTKEFFCVIHMDSSLSFFEQDSIAYECILPGERNIPSTLVYVERIDSFVTVSTAYEVECFRYQDLAQSSEAGGKVIEPIWTTNIGMDWMALDVTTLQIIGLSDQAVIMILGENHFMSIADDGSVRFIKRLDYSPMCFHCFIIGWYWEPNARLITSIVSESGSLLIYEESKLMWAAQLSEVPVAIQRTNINGLAGAIITLSETGNVQVGYLGSEPQPFKVPPLNLSELNYENVQKELAELEKDIKSGIDFTDLSLTKALAKKDLQLKITVDANLETCRFPTKIPFEMITQMCKVSVILTPSIMLEQIQIHFVALEPLVCSKPMHFLRNVPIAISQQIEVWMYFKDATPFHSTKMKVVVSFINQQSICRILEENIALPMKMFFAQHSPQKDASNKVTFSVEGVDTPSLSSLFHPDYSIDSDFQAVGFKSNLSNTVITVVAAKSSNRLRIQSDDLTLFGAFLEVIKRRIEDFSEKSTLKSQIEPPKVKLIFLPKIPINEILSKIDDHVIAVDKVKLLQEKLDSRSSQMRLILRSMFIKLEDKRQKALDGIMMLHKTTQVQINDVLKELDLANCDLKRCRQNLSCAIAMCRIIMENLDLPPNVTEGLCAILITPTMDWLNNTWEVITNDSLDRLNHIGALRKNKNTSIDDNPSYAATSLDINRYKRRLSSLLERVCRLCSKKDNSQDDNNLLENDYLEEENEEEHTSDWISDNRSQLDFKHS